MSTADWIGLFGVVCYQIAYAGLQLGFLQRDSRQYTLLNLFGPCCLLYSLLFHFNFSAALSQVLWLLWSVLGLVKLARLRRQAAALAIESAQSIGIAGIAVPNATAMNLAIIDPARIEAAPVSVELIGAESIGAEASRLI